MKSGFESQLESLIRRRFQDRDTRFLACLVKVKREHNSRGVLVSSSTVVAMHAELEREFMESGPKPCRVSPVRPTLQGLTPGCYNPLSTGEVAERLKALLC